MRNSTSIYPFLTVLAWISCASPWNRYVLFGNIKTENGNLISLDAIEGDSKFGRQAVIRAAIMRARDSFFIRLNWVFPEIATILAWSFDENSAAVVFSTSSLRANVEYVDEGTSCLHKNRDFWHSP